VQFSGIVASRRELSLQTAGVLEPDCLQCSGAAAKGIKSAGFCLLLSMEQWELWVPFTQVYQFPWHFRAKAAFCVAGEHGAPSSCVCWEGGLTAKH
jgi:hypothetical protein